MTVGHFISIRAEDTLSTTHNKSPMYILSPSNNRLLKSIVATKIFEPLPAQNVPGRSVPSLLGNGLSSKSKSKKEKEKRKEKERKNET